MAYPDDPGARRHATGGTSQAAAASVKPKAGAQAQAVLAMLADGPASPEELTTRLHRRGEPALLTSIRARCTQLHKLGLVADSGLRGLGESGRAKVIRWRLTSAEERAAAPEANSRETIYLRRAGRVVLVGYTSGDHDGLLARFVCPDMAAVAGQALARKFGATFTGLSPEAAS